MLTKSLKRFALNSLACLAFAVLIHLVWTQGLPLWDDDYFHGYGRLSDRSLLRIFFDILSPYSDKAQDFGFSDRPVVSFIFRLCYLIEGYSGHLLYWVKNLALAATMILIYHWSVFIGTEAKSSVRLLNVSRWTAGFLILFAFFLPATVAAQIWIADFSALSVFWSLGVAYGMIHLLFKGPPAQGSSKHWALTWAILIFALFIGYRIKSDTKVIALTFAIYVALFERRQWKWYLGPVLASLLLAIPWGPELFADLPPFLPGSRKVTADYVWKSGGLERIGKFLWSQPPEDFHQWLVTPTAGLVTQIGPLLVLVLVAVGIFLGFRRRMRLSEMDRRVFFFAAIWCGLILLGTSALPDINPFFTVRYALIFFVPFTILISWSLKQIFAWDSRWQKGVIITFLILVGSQLILNAMRSVNYRKDLGGWQSAIDDIYSAIDAKPEIDTIYAFEFRPYQFRPDAKPAFRNIRPLNLDLMNIDQVTSLMPMKTAIVSPRAPFQETIEIEARSTGCRGSLFNHLFPCGDTARLYFLKYIGRPSVLENARLKAKLGFIDESWVIVNGFLQAHSGHPVARAMRAELYELRNLKAEAESDWRTLARDYPDLPLVKTAIGRLTK